MTGNATPECAACTFPASVVVYPTEVAALRAALEAVGAPSKLPEWYDALLRLYLRAEEANRA